MTEIEIKKWIDKASYETLLRKWRFAAAGDPIFIKGICNYYSRALHSKRKEIGEANHTVISKKIGWGRNG